MTARPRKRMRAKAYAASEQSTRLLATMVVVTTVVFQNHRENCDVRKTSP